MNNEKQTELIFCWSELNESNYQTLNAFSKNNSLILSDVARIYPGKTVQTTVDGMPFGGFKSTSKAKKEIEKVLELI